MSAQELFSTKTKAVINESRLIAIELGYTYISTIHIFLADCRINDHTSIRNFVFKDTQEFQAFFDTQTIDKPTILTESLPLTLEAEQTIRKSVLLFHHNYRDTEIHPYHLFLAASQLKSTLFYAVIKHRDELSKKLKRFYVDNGIIDVRNISETLWSALAKKF